MTYSLKTNAYLLDPSGEEHEIQIRIEFDCDYQPECISGPPEDCYPACGELTMTDIHILSEPLPYGITEDDVKLYADANLEDECWEEYHATQHEPA